MKCCFYSCCLCGLFLLLSCGCRREMYSQPRSDPLEPSKFFKNGAASRPLVPGTVARGHLDADQAFYQGAIGTNFVEEFPMPVTRQVLERGRERYNIYCSVCHGAIGDGNGMIPQRGYPHPPSYHIDRLRQAPVGHYYDVITHGYGVMYSYASRVEPADRWAITAYIRALQLSQNSRLDDLPPNERVKLEAQNK
ncbi:MAG: ABC-type Fe3+ transport system protein [Pedosphaera sp.]|nr:ABC-type Fe3+ transport system protein [Pedosphaera sp.]